MERIGIAAYLVGKKRDNLAQIGDSIRIVLSPSVKTRSDELKVQFKPSSSTSN